MDKQEFYDLINTADEPKIGHRTVNWGKGNKQRKRVNGMITGGMSTNLKGNKKYVFVIIDVSDYETICKDLKGRNNSELYRYQLARNAGFNHKIAMIYTIKGDEAYEIINNLQLI